MKNLVINIVCFVVLIAVSIGISALICQIFDAKMFRGLIWFVAFIISSLLGWLYKYIMTTRYSQKSKKNGSFVAMAIAIANENEYEYSVNNGKEKTEVVLDCGLGLLRIFKSDDDGCYYFVKHKCFIVEYQHVSWFQSVLSQNGFLPDGIRFSLDQRQGDGMIILSLATRLEGDVVSTDEIYGYFKSIVEDQFRPIVNNIRKLYNDYKNNLTEILSERRTKENDLCKPYKEATGTDLLVKGGNGTSIEDAIYVVPSPDYINTEYECLNFLCYLNNAQRTETQQSLINQNGRKYDRLTVNVIMQTEEGKQTQETVTFFFDVTEAMAQYDKV